MWLGSGPTGDRSVQVGLFGAAVESGAQRAGFRMEARFEAPTNFAALDWLRLLQVRARNRPINGAITAATGI